MDNFESRIEEIHCRLECGDPGLRYCAAKELGFLLINLHTSALEVHDYLYNSVLNSIRLH